MSVQVDNRTGTRTARRDAVRTAGPRPAPVPAWPAPSVGSPVSPGSPGRFDGAKLDLVFEVVLALAACLSLVIVVQQAVVGDDAGSSEPAPATSGQGVEDAPPSVFVQAD